jgi:hypothetical protein
MYTKARYLTQVTAIAFAVASGLHAQQSDAPQRTTLSGLRAVAVHARVQAAGGARLQRFDEALLRTKMVDAMRQEGIGVQDAEGVRDGSAAQISLVYLVLPVGEDAGPQAGFVASSCLHALQYVRIPRLERGGRIAYTVAPTWSSCGLMVGDTASYARRILRNADVQIARFLRAWRSVNSTGSPAGTYLGQPRTLAPTSHWAVAVTMASPAGTGGSYGQ